MEFDLVQLRELLVNTLHVFPDKIYLCSDLKIDLALEILNRIKLIIYLEMKYKVKFIDGASGRYETLFEMIAFVVMESYHHESIP